MSTTSPSSLPSALGPVSNRIALLDVLRGFALFGILLANIETFSGSGLLSQHEVDALPDGSLTTPLEFAVTALIESKFYCLFSFLFGLGFAVIVERAGAHGVRPAVVLMRRYLTLLGIGLIHSALIWFGDILVLYSLLGMALLLFRHVWTRTLLISATALLLAPIPLYVIGLLSLPAGWRDEMVTPERMQWGIHAVTAGHYQDIVPVNIYFNGANWFRRLVVMFYPRVFGMFLLGFAVCRMRILHAPAQHLPLLRASAKWGLLVGLPFSIGWATVNWDQPTTPLSAVGLVSTILQSVGTPALTIGYVASITLAFQDERWRRLLLHLAPVGRIALTNYLSQSVIGILIFYQFGLLGLFMRVSYAESLLIAMAIYAAQLVFSSIWVRHFAQGPVEWVWRRLTYGRRTGTATALGYIKASPQPKAERLPNTLVSNGSLQRRKDSGSPAAH